MALTEFSAALNQVAAEKGITVESVLNSVKMGLAMAYKKDRKESGEEVNIEEIVVDINSDNGEIRILKEGKDVTPAGFGRIAAQTAKQVFQQKNRENEKNVVLEEFKAKIGQIVLGQILRVDGSLVTLDLGKSHASGVMPQSEQVSSEQYRMNQRIKVLVKDVREGPKGTEIVVSRSDADFVKKLFEQEVPEIAAGTVIIEAIAREAGSRTKMAVSSREEKIDPVGSCVGQKGVRVQSIITELFGEKIDIIQYSPIAEKFIAAALQPAKVTDVELDKENNRAVVSVPEDQQSLAIGKEGQNARLANKLTKWKIDIKGTVGVFESPEAIHQKQESASDSKKKVVGVWDAAIKKTAPKKEIEPEAVDDSAKEDSANSNEA